ncbi:glycosyltransferase [Candidatus Dependentiae bacterium]|nr:glycosyltransferase [Candidatus Dependentiae bacterium]
MKRLWLLSMICFTPLLTLYGLDEVSAQWIVNPCETQSLKILMATYTFPKLSETFVINQVVGLIEKGHDVSIWAKTAEENKVHEAVNAYNLVAKTYYGELPPDLETYDVVICQFGPLGNEFLHLKQSLKLKAKLVTFFRGFDISQYLYENEGCYDVLLKKCDLIATNCDFFRKRLLALGSDPKKTIVYHSAIDCSKFPYTYHATSNKEVTNIITVGRLVEKKGMDDVVEAVQKVLAKGKNVHLTIIGEGYRAKKNLKKLVAQLGINDSVTFAGWRTSAEIARYLKESDIFVLASKTARNFDQDAIPNVIKEAMASGLPVISTRHGGIPELIEDGINGCLVDEGHSDQIANRIIYLMDNPDLRATFSINGRRAVEQLFDITKKADELSDILKNLFFVRKPADNMDTNLNDSLNSIQDHIASFHNNIKQQSDKIKHLTHDFHRLTDENQKLKTENNDLMTNNQKLSKENQHVSSENLMYVNKNQLLTEENQTFHSENSKLVGKNKLLTDSYHMALTENHAWTTKHQELIANNQELINKNQDLINKNQELIRENEELLAVNNKMETQIQEASVILAG